jgi:hypothetical protein
VQRFTTVACVAIACGACTHTLSSYYPLEAGRAWDYTLGIEQGNASKKSLQSSARVSNLPPQPLQGRSVTPQESRQFGQSTLRFIAEDRAGIAEVATQWPGEPGPRSESSPNYLLKQPLREGTTWVSLWRSNQFGVAAQFPVTKRIVRYGETIEAPAGRFQDCLRVQLSGTGSVRAPQGPTPIQVSGDEWYCAGAGFVRGTFREELPEFPEQRNFIELNLTRSDRP